MFSHLDYCIHLLTGLPTICYAPARVSLQNQHRIWHHSAQNTSLAPPRFSDCPNSSTQLQSFMTCDLSPKDCPASSPTIPSSHWERLSIPPASRPFALTVPSAWNALSFPLVYSCWTNCWFKGHLLQRPPLDLDSISSFIVCSPVKSASPIREFTLLPVALYLMSVS